jgi:RNA-directed DNA polymerase
MPWETYETQFLELAAKNNYAESNAHACLRYAKRLYVQGLPPIYDVRHLSLLVGYDEEFLFGCAYAPERFYRRFSVPKRSGGHRLIDEPLPSLKEIQRWLLDAIIGRVPVSRYAKGFVRGRSTRDNARFHRAQPLVLSLDIRDFFPSIKRQRIYGIFRSLGYSQLVSQLLARLCTLDNALPQGAPTSPALSNLFVRHIDSRLGGFARSQNLRYTRYADDLTFSGALRPGQVIRFVRSVLATQGLSLNEDKTRAMQPHQRQEVTGIVVNHHLDLPRETRRELRQTLYYIDRFGVGSHLQHTGEQRANFLLHLHGLLSFALHLNPSRTELKAAAERVKLLLSASTQRAGEDRDDKDE